MGIIRVPIGRGHLAKGGAGEIGHIGVGEEVDVVEGIQELGAEIKVDRLADPDLLCQAQIEAREPRPGDIDILRAGDSTRALSLPRVLHDG